MANNCAYCIKAVSPKKEALDRLIDIMRYKDKEFYMYRVFTVGFDEQTKKEDGLYVKEIYGDVAWAASAWVHDAPDPNDIHEETGSHYSTLPEICPALDVGVEIFTEEPGMEFQEHYMVNHTGKVTCSEVEKWTPYTDDGEDDEDDDDDAINNNDEHCDGLNNYMEWVSAEEIYGVFPRYRNVSNPSGGYDGD